MSEPLDVGFLGYRFRGKTHASAFERLPMFFPDAPEIHRDVLISRDEAALSEAKETLGFDRTSTDWEAVVDEVDVLYNLSPDFFHKGFASGNSVESTSAESTSWGMSYVWKWSFPAAWFDSQPHCAPLAVLSRPGRVGCRSCGHRGPVVSVRSRATPGQAYTTDC